MIRPDKHTEIKTSVTYIAGLAMKEINLSGIIEYEALRRSIMSKIGMNVGDSFVYALGFLFLLNRITYNQSSDTITTAS